MIILDACENLSILGVILFIKNLLKIICVLTPIILLLFLTIDFVKATMENDSEKMSKVKSTAIKRIVYAILVFLVPVIVNGVMGLLDDATSFSACYEAASSENVQLLAEVNKLEREIQKAETQERRFELIEKQAQLYDQVNKNLKSADVSTNNSVIATKYTKSNGKVAQATSGPGGRYDKNKGDQSGKEVSKNRKVPNKASYIVRFKDPSKAEMMARCGEAGAENNHIGYSVRDYTSLYREAKKVNWDLSKITKDCTTVCSAFVSVCINSTGTKITKHLNGFGYNKSLFKSKKAFTVIEPYKKSKLMRGDIIVHECPGNCGHMSIAR